MFLTAEATKAAVEERLADSAQIRKRIDAFCADTYGIERFSEIVEKHFPVQDKKLQVCLARQIPTANIEHLAVKAAVDCLQESGVDATTVFLSFVRDGFASNCYKMSLVKLPFIFRSRKGKIVVEGQKILDKQQRYCIEGRIFAYMRTIDGNSLVEHHKQMLCDALKIKSETLHFLDASDFFTEILCKAKKNGPMFVYKKRGEKEVKAPFRGHVEADKVMRPPADWYYLFYLFIFADGRRALASTVDEDPRVVQWFEKSVAQIKDICGFVPLLLSTPLKVSVQVGVNGGAKTHHSKLNEIPKKALSNNGWMHAIPSPDLADTFYNIVRHYEEQFIACC